MLTNAFASQCQVFDMSRIARDTVAERETMAGEKLREDMTWPDDEEGQMPDIARLALAQLFCDYEMRWNNTMYKLVGQCGMTSTTWYHGHCGMCQLREAQQCPYAFSAAGEHLCRMFNIDSAMYAAWEKRGPTVKIASNYTPGSSGAVAFVLYTPRTMAEGKDEREYFGSEGPERARKDAVFPMERKIICIRSNVFVSSTQCKLFVRFALHAMGAYFNRKGIEVRLYVLEKSMETEDQKEGVD